VMAKSSCNQTGRFRDARRSEGERKMEVK